jgi:hypothetical protein
VWSIHNLRIANFRETFADIKSSVSNELQALFNEL